MKKEFILYNIAVIITWIVGYTLLVLFIDILHYKAWFIGLDVAVITYSLRYILLFRVKSIRRWVDKIK